ncbi:MAG: hypothetical protein GC200_06915 [Tepidisphaera sp.]|nr:hypothetical protein [Tepidisphaera sp.]
MKHAPRRSSLHRTTGSARATGLFAAAFLLLGFAGVIIFFARRERAGAVPPPMTDTSRPPDITKIPTGNGGGMATGLVQGSAMQVQLVDDKDPSRVQAEITADRSTPLANDEFSFVKPKARVYLRDGRTVVVDADKGRARMPQGAAGRPQNGLLEGNVVIRLFPPTPGHKISPTDTPLLTTTAPSVKFDASLGRLEFPAGVKTVGDQIDFEGQGLTVLYDEAKKRIDGAHLEHLTRLIIYPGPARPAPRIAAAPAPPAPAAPQAPAASTASPAAATIAPPQPVETLYRLVAHDQVSVRQGARSITSDDMLAWLRLVDGKLRPAAVASLAPPTAPDIPASHASAFRVLPAAYQPVGAAVKLPAPSAKPASPDDPIEIHWSGAMDAALESSTPGELARNDVFVRFTSPRPLGVLARDEASRASARGSLIDYGATVREATVSGADTQGAKLESDGRGEALGQRFEIALNTGLVRSPGPGQLRALGKANAPQGTLAWANDAEFQMAMDRGQIQPRPTSAKLRGKVHASDGAATVNAESLDATFFPGTSALSYVKMVGNATADDGKPDAGRLSADTLDLNFEPLAGGDSRPSRVDLNGHASVAQRDQSLAAGRIIADLSPGENGRTDVTAMNATQDVTVRGKDGLTITGDEVRATPADDWAEVRSRAVDGVRMCQGASTILTSHVQFDGRSRLVHVPAPGTLWHEITPSPSDASNPNDAPSNLQLTWGDWLEFDDAAGVGRCQGATVAILTRPGSERDTLRADSAEIRLSQPAPGQRRVLDTAIAIGTPQRPASAESKHFAPGGEQVVQAMYVEGARIEADQSRQQFSVPGAGKALLADHREADPGTQAQASPGARPGLALGNTSARGDTLLTWNDSMQYDRSAGRLHVVGKVRSIHVLDQERMQLDCEDLVANLSTDAAPDRQGRLTSALASGGAWLRTQGRELAAGQVSFDAINQIATADANIGGPVTITDPKTGVPVKASHVTWYMKDDRIEAKGVQQIAAPK